MLARKIFGDGGEAVAMPKAFVSKIWGIDGIARKIGTIYAEVGRLLELMAERQGFEPWIPCGIHAFQACAFSHSAISPL
jgi:hypothetical protein